MTENLNVFGQMQNFLGSNRNFSVPIEKEVREIDKDGNESVITISYKIKFMDSARFWPLHLKIWLLVSQKEFIKLSVEIAIVFLNMNVPRSVS